MARRSFSVRVEWDEDAGVYYVAESDIVGLHVEAATLDEFEALLMEVGPELVVANHLSKADLETGDVADLIPAIIWRRPEKNAAAA